jgi:endo-1,4-beta-mannosidase
MLDHLFATCAERGVYVMLCLVNHGKFSIATDSNWAQNPYNKAANPQGGFLDHPEDLWTSAQAKMYLKRNWRYLVARYGAYTSLMSWEIFNEMEWTENYRYHVGDSAKFHREMGDFLKATDPYPHLVTTSYAHALGFGRDVWDAGMQYTQEHIYGGLEDTSQAVASLATTLRARYPGKPFYLGEMGLGGSGGSENAEDPTGVFIHNANWASLTAKAGGGGFPWWWDNYVDPLNLYWRWTGIAAFVKGEDLDARGYQPVTFEVDSLGPADIDLNFWGERPSPKGEGFGLRL